MSTSLLLLLLACQGDTGDTGTPAIDIEATVAAALAAGCDAESLDALQGADPAQVRAALVGLDTQAKLADWTPGVSHNHPVDVAFVTPLLSEFDFDYTLYVPESYTADPDAPMPLYVDPAHPTDPVRDESMPTYAELAPEPMFMVQVNFFNRLYTDLGDDAYYDEVVYNEDFDKVDAYQDNVGAIDAVVAELKRRFHIDPERIYTGGVSAEGNSAWMQGILSSEVYGGILPVSAGTAGYDEDLYRNLENTGILVVHGTEDGLVDVESVDPTVEMLEGWGFDIEYWRMEGEGHGTMFTALFDEMTEWLFARSRPVGPRTVHKGIKSARDVDAYWLAASALSVEVSGDADIYPSAPPAVLAATWEAGAVSVEASGVAQVELRWIEGDAGPATGRAADTVAVTVNGTDLGPVTLEEDPLVAVADYCVHGDVTRLWAGRVRVDLP